MTLPRWLRIRPSFLVGFALFVALFAWLVWWFALRTPGQSFEGPLPQITEAQETIEATLRRHVKVFGGDIGARSTQSYAGLERAVEHLAGELEGFGYSVDRQPYRSGSHEVTNLVVEKRGKARPDSIVVVGAHYDGVGDMPAANDNGSGVAALLVLAERFRGLEVDETLRFVLFANEEPPHFQEETMGSLVYARACREKDEDIRMMWSLETLGYYTDEPDSQDFPSHLLELAFPSTGNFVAFVSMMSDAETMRHVLGEFREHCKFPSEGAALPDFLPQAGWSDHWSFNQVGYPGVMITDTALFRYEHYHTTADLPDQLNYPAFARVVEGLVDVLASEVGAVSPR